MDFLQYIDEIKKNNGLKDEQYILGIDLGTTNTVVSFWNDKNKKAEPIDISMGFGKIPIASVVQLRENDTTKEWIVGEEAYRSMNIYHDSTSRSIKRLMGTDQKVKLSEEFFTPEEISAKILEYVIDCVLKLSPKAEIVGIVITVPYDFDDVARKNTIKALEIAGYKDKLICLMEEPKAVALSYSMENEINYDEKILIFDFGGGTLDTTLFHVTQKDDEKIKMEVINESGKAFHGGDNIDYILLDKFYEYLEKESNIVKADLTDENIAELTAKAVETKERLSGVKSYRIPFTFAIPPFVKPMNRNDFEELISDFVEKTRQLVLNTLVDTKEGTLSVDEIDKVIVGGGSSKMPWVRNMLNDIFNDDSKIYMSKMPATDISVGACIYGAMKMGVFNSPDILTEYKNLIFDLSIPHDIGFLVENKGKQSFYTMIKRGTSYKTAKKEKVFTLNADTIEEMTTFNLTILERINKNDDVSKCIKVGEVDFLNLPKREIGKTKLLITISAIDESGLIKGSVEDLGFDGLYEKSGYYKTFEPTSNEKLIIK